MAIKMPATREIIVGVGLLVVFAVAMLLVLNIYKQEGEKRSAAISEEGEKDPNHIEVFVKLMAVDPAKGDISARLEFIPQGKYAKDEGGALAQPLKLYVNAASGKQEHDFSKDKRMNPVDVTVSMYDGLVTDYPFDKHKAFLELYFTEAEVPKSSAQNQGAGGGGGSSSSSSASTPPANPSAETTQAATPTPAPAGQETGQQAGAPAKEGDDGPEDVSIAVDFFGSIPGMKIEAAKAKESTDDYVGIDMDISRSSTVKFFSIFIIILMWGAAIAVLFLVLSILLRGRKIEVGMFSFLSALIFALVAVRNSQPGVPPIGTFSDFISFFWAEVILALCLMTILFTWLVRPTAK